jgi:predicted metal-binding membrane protein
VSEPGSATALERVLRRDRLLVVVGIAGLLAPAWIYLVRASLDMYGDMRGPAAWMMRATWDAAYFAQMSGMWTVMMAGMMLPSAAPATLLFARVARSGESPRRPVLRTYLFAAGYLLCWSAFALAATALQAALASSRLLTPMMESASPFLTAALLALAGAYQLSRLKRACLSRCRTPAAFIAEHWRPGLVGALRVGIAHGAWCVGCCWALMLLLFAGGVMSLAAIAGLSVFALLEKLAPFGPRGDRWIGALLLAAAGASVAAILA